MNSRFFTVLTLVIAIVALVVSVVALNKAGGQADIREAIESFKSEIETTSDDLTRARLEIAAQMGTKLQLTEAKAHLLTAKMYVALDNNYDKAAEELQKAADNFDKARTGASEVTRDKIAKLKSGVTDAQKQVRQKSARSIDKLIKLLQQTEEAIDVSEEESAK